MMICTSGSGQDGHLGSLAPRIFLSFEPLPRNMCDEFGVVSTIMMGKDIDLSM